MKQQADNRDLIFSLLNRYLILFLIKKIYFIGWMACEILGPWPGMEPHAPAVEAQVLTTGPPGHAKLL